MRRQMFGVGILAGSMCVTALGGGTGVAMADPDSPVTPIIDQVLTETPDLFVDSRDEGGPSLAWGGTGMYCENAYVRCR